MSYSIESVLRGPQRPCPHCQSKDTKLVDWNEAKCFACGKRVPVVDVPR